MFAAKNELFTRPSGGFVIPRSLRFRASASAYLNRTFGTPTSNTTWTLSLWLKRGLLGDAATGKRNDIFSAGTEEIIFYQGTEVLQLRSGSASTAVFRDTSAWYHLVIVSNGTTVKGYINNSEVVSYTGTMTSFNSAVAHTIGQYQNNLAADGFFDGYMAEINFVDGQALATTSFGTTSTITGVWSPIKYSGTYGNNGFHLDFNSYATTAALGTDTSGNSNTWTVNGCSVTAGVTYDSMIDVPTVTDTGSNYAVLNPLAKRIGFGTIVYAGGNLNASNAAGSGDYAYGTLLVNPNSGVFWAEITVTTVGGTIQLGVDNYTSLDNTDTNQVLYIVNGNKSVAGSVTAYGSTFTATDVIGIELNTNSGTVTFWKQTSGVGSFVSQGAISLPVTTVPLGIFAVLGSSGGAISLNCGQRPLNNTSLPNSAKTFNTYNLAAPSILKGNLYMDATTYTGTGASLGVTNAGGFQPDWVWTKSRSAATDNKLTDSVRGVTKAVISNTTGAETTDTQGLTAFNTGGFTVGTNTDYNNLAATYVGWQWKGGGAAVSNTSGTITSSVSASATSGFSVVTYTGNGSNGASIGHGLGVTPQLVLFKDRSGAVAWIVYHVSLGSNTYLTLNNTTAGATATGFCTPSSSLITFTTTYGNTNSSGDTYVAYCFTPIAGFSAFGSYVGNSNVDGPFAYLGFRPRYLMIKNASSASFPWVITDTARNPTNTGTDENELRANSTQSEAQAAADYPSTIDILSNGFKIRENNTTCYTNESGSTFIYAAFAENPFNNSLAR